MAKLDIQGPSTRKEIENALKIRLPDIEYYHFRQLEMDGVQCILSRTGYTGEFGYELYLPSDQAVKFWRRILAQNSILPAGLGARDTLRVEMGYPLYGHELNRNHTPAGVTHRKFIDLNKSFIGREAVLRALEDEATRQLAGLRLEGRMAARPNDIILEDGHEIGKVTSGLFSPSLNVAVALGYLERQFASVGQRLNINSRGKNLTAEVVKLPFYKQGTAKL
jgi:aminomethyltransferase